MSTEDWSTPEGLRAIARSRAERIGGWRAPVAFAVGYRTSDAGEWVFPHVNEPGRASALSAVLLAETVGYAAGTAEFVLTGRQLAAAIERLSPAEATPGIRHANLEAWRGIGATEPAEIVAVFVADIGDAPVGPADEAFRRLL